MCSGKLLKAFPVLRKPTNINDNVRYGLVASMPNKMHRFLPSRASLLNEDDILDEII